MLEVDDRKKRKLPHEETTSKIIGAAFEVHDQLGYGFLERKSSTNTSSSKSVFHPCSSVAK
jgi:hypothetical protein